MLDENLPTFYLSSNKKDKSNNNVNVLFTQYGNEPEPAYSLRCLDPAQPSSRNRYAVALYDPYIPDVLYGEVLIIPEWTQPSLSAEAIRQNGGVAPPPEPILPSQFIIHLYNPDQDVVVRHKPKTWNSQPSWEFEMPQQSFKQPSSSTLDQIQTGPAMSDVTPKLKFVWRKDGSLSKDFACYLSGKTTTPDGRKKNKEPDITVSIFKSLREITLYEPNLYRVEMEDFKGLELVLMLGAVVIRDVYFTPVKDAFNVVSSPTSSRTNVTTAASIAPGSNPTAATLANGNAASTQSHQTRDSRPTPSSQPLDPRMQWEIDAENARLKHQEEVMQRERRRKAEEEERKTRKLIEAEQKAQRKKQAEIDKETERLKKVFGMEDQRTRQQRLSPSHQARYSHYMPTQQQQRQQSLGPYMQPPGGNYSSVNFHQSQQQLRPQSSMSFHAAAGAQRPTASAPDIPRLKAKKSIFGFLKPSEDGDSSKLNKKRSSLF
ncbi:hypothetical protein UA08_08509 [Talaromyces atroroseus]|uniref:Uncharacterized protein n=1 Tax=Talaromyces atroroseus TaxID=1441469 RepID=A0A1Q5Q819_TALAT|nr:hypothetical protein UA08_08509 [Talaromyces atroroseus]OKL56357.1 hypothetical protein UA08_08509 [Talaromyces atroroseus]